MFRNPSSLGNLSVPRLALFIAWLSTAASIRAADFRRAAVEAHFLQNQSIDVIVDETRTFALADGATGDRTAGHNVNGDRKIECSELHFAFLNGSAKYERHFKAETVNYWASKDLPSIVSQIRTISPTGKVEELTTQRLNTGHLRSFGGVRQLDAFPPEETIDIALGLRLLGSSTWLTQDDLRGMIVSNSPDDDIVVLQTHDATSHTHELHFDRRFLYALTYYRCANAYGDVVEITNSHFCQINGLFVPGQVVRTSSIVDHYGHVSHPLTFTYSTRQVHIGDSANALANYSIAWPAGLHLFDARTNDQVDVGPTTRPISDDDIRKQLAAKAEQQARWETFANKRMKQILQAGDN